jgi:uncharacterized membrane protein YgdD (TMEM256/DUF423 family)
MMNDVATGTLDKVSGTDVHRRWLPIGAALAMLAVIAGAFGAHGLRGRLPADLMSVYQTAALYHFLHALGLMGIGAIHGTRVAVRQLDLAGWLVFAGVIIFSGSLYALAIGGWRQLGAITPVGGALMIVGWAVVAWATRKLLSTGKTDR